MASNAHCPHIASKNKTLLPPPSPQSGSIKTGWLASFLPLHEYSRREMQKVVLPPAPPSSPGLIFKSLFKSPNLGLI